MIHYLDDVRHGLSAMWAYPAWAGNISAGVIVGVVGTLLWPRTRKAIERWLHGHLETHLAAHHESIKRLIQDHLVETRNQIDVLKESQK